MNPLRVLRDELHVSVSQLKTYLRCPRSYELRYVSAVEPAFVPVALAFGKSIHAALAAFYLTMAATQEAPPIDLLIEQFLDSWAHESSGPVPLGGTSGAGDPIELARAMLNAFHERATSQEPLDVEAVELPFAVDLHDPDTGELIEEKLVGAFDLVVRDGERRVIIEHKSAARRWTDDQMQFDLQASGYRLAARELGLGDVGLRLQVITKTKSPALFIHDLKRDERDEDDFLRAVVGVLRAIDADAFYPVRGWQCKGCQYAHACAGASS